MFSINVLLLAMYPYIIVHGAGRRSHMPILPCAACRQAKLLAQVARPCSGRHRGVYSICLVDVSGVDGCLPGVASHRLAHSRVSTGAAWYIVAYGFVRHGRAHRPTACLSPHLCRTSILGAVEHDITSCEPVACARVFFQCWYSQESYGF